MIKRIELKNFMSHRHTVIEPAAGLTVLVGPNNCGKSAVVTALQILCSNEASTYVLRHGERECWVEVETNEGHVVRWSRKTSPSYRINGQLFDRLRNAGLPDELHAVLRLPAVDAGEGSSFDIHFGCQKSPIFLLDDSPSAAAKFFASSSDAIRLVEMQRRHREKHQEKQKEKGRLEAESKQLNAELDALQPAAEIDHRLRSAEELYQTLNSLAHSIEQLETESSRIEGQATVASYYQAQAASLAPLAEPPPLEPTEPLELLLSRLVDGGQAETHAASRAEALRRLPDPPALSETGELSRLASDLFLLAQTIEKETERKTALQTLALPPNLQPTDQLELVIEQLRSWHVAAQSQEQRGLVLANVSPPPQQADVQVLASHAAAMAQALAEWQGARSMHEAIERLSRPPELVPCEPLEKVVVDLEAALALNQRLTQMAEEAAAVSAELAAEIRARAENETCPTCGAPLDADRMLAAASSPGGHAHG